MTKPKRRLRNGTIKRVDAVWQGANWDMADGVGSRMLVFKSAATPQGGTVKTTTDGMTYNVKFVPAGGTIEPGPPSATVLSDQSSGPPAIPAETSGMADEASKGAKPADPVSPPTVEPTASVDMAKAIEDAVAKAVADATLAAEAKAAVEVAELRKSVEALTDAAAERGYQAKAAEYLGVADEAELVATLKAAASVSPEAYDVTCSVLAKAAERIGAAKATGGNLLGEIGSTRTVGITSHLAGAGGELDTLTKAIAAEKSIPVHQAQLLALEQRPDLYEAFRKESGLARQVIVGPNG